MLLGQRSRALDVGSSWRLTSRNSSARPVTGAVGHDEAGCGERVAVDLGDARRRRAARRRARSTERRDRLPRAPAPTRLGSRRGSVPPARARRGRAPARRARAAPRRNRRARRRARAASWRAVLVMSLLTPPCCAARIRPAISTRVARAERRRRRRRARPAAGGGGRARAAVTTSLDRAEHRQAGGLRRGGCWVGKVVWIWPATKAAATPAPSATNRIRVRKQRPVRRGRHARHARRIDHLELERAGPASGRRCAAAPARDWRATGHIAASARHSRG